MKLPPRVDNAAALCRGWEKKTLPRRVLKGQPAKGYCSSETILEEREKLWKTRAGEIHRVLLSLFVSSLFFADSALVLLIGLNLLLWLSLCRRSPMATISWNKWYDAGICSFKSARLTLKLICGRENYFPQNEELRMLQIWASFLLN